MIVLALYLPCFFLLLLRGLLLLFLLCIFRFVFIELMTHRCRPVERTRCSARVPLS